MSMLIKMGSAQQAIYKVSGSIAALVKESVWEALLKGKAVQIIEPDPERWSFYLADTTAPGMTQVAGKHKKTFKARSLSAAVFRVKRDFPSYTRWHIDGNRAYLDESQGYGMIMAGYPNIISLPQERIAKFSAHGLDAKKCAAKCREFIHKTLARKESMMGIFAFMDEIERGLERQGRD